MKTKFKISFSILFLWIALSGCQEIEDGFIDLSSIEKEEGYKEYSFLGTRWQIVGIADSKRNMIKIANSNQDFWLVFHHDGLIKGMSGDTNSIGSYIINSQSDLTISEFDFQYGDDPRPEIDNIVKNMKEVFAYRISEYGLELQYDSEKNLLFRPASINDLCTFENTLENSGKECLGEFLYRMKDFPGQIKFSETLGYYVQIQTQGTYDCSILGIVCDDKDVRELVGSTLSFSADLHNSGLNYSPPIGGQKVFSLNNLTFK